MLCKCSQYIEPLAYSINLSAYQILIWQRNVFAQPFPWVVDFLCNQFIGWGAIKELPHVYFFFKVYLPELSKHILDILARWKLKTTSLNRCPSSSSNICLKWLKDQFMKQKGEFHSNIPLAFAMTVENVRWKVSYNK